MFEKEKIDAWDCAHHLMNVLHHRLSMWVPAHPVLKEAMKYVAVVNSNAYEVSDDAGVFAIASEKRTSVLVWCFRIDLPEGKRSGGW